jgi:hypothetical protein
LFLVLVNRFSSAVLSRGGRMFEMWTMAALKDAMGR